jgi:oligopeptide transport system permease protein
MVMGTTIFLATIMVIMNLLSDIAYKIFDPRVDLS